MEVHLVPRVFVSYSHHDSRIAMRIARDLDLAGAGVWIDKKGILPSQVVFETIVQALDNSDFVVLLLSPTSAESASVREELVLAKQREQDGRLHIVIVLLESAPLPTPVAGRLYIDFRNSADDAASFARLLEALSINRASAILDASYKQYRWHGSPTRSAGYEALGNILATCTVLREHKTGYASRDALEDVDILVLPTPFGTQVPFGEFTVIADWVRHGGALVTFGVYLMERHHYNNLNQLMRLFGIEFGTNLLMPAGRDSDILCRRQAEATAEQQYWLDGRVTAIPVNHALFANVSKLVLVSSCSVEADLPCDCSAFTDVKCSVMTARGLKDPQSGKIERLDQYIKDKAAYATICAARTFGAGKIVVVGSWKVFHNDLIGQGDNTQLLRNILRWFGSNNEPLSVGNGAAIRA
ncbi:MAG: toll/interleukin-1 receptor domain-containing protein [Candidatus Eisenbacteria bacterium]